MAMETQRGQVNLGSKKCHSGGTSALSRASLHGIINEEDRPYCNFLEGGQFISSKDADGCVRIIAWFCTNSNY